MSNVVEQLEYIFYHLFGKRAGSYFGAFLTIS